jgi:putative endonuclease
MPRAERWRAYLLRCGDGSLYCGASNDVARRLAAHASGKGARYTRSRGTLALAWRSAPLAKPLALSLEARIKRLDRADKLAVRGVSVQLREEADRCFRSLDCPAKIKTQEEIQRLLSLLGRLEGLISLTLRSLEAVDAVFSEDGLHACCPRLEGLAIKLRMVSSSSSCCMHGGRRRHAPGRRGPGSSVPHVCML